MRRIKDYIKYNLQELEEYAKTEGSCINKVNNEIHIGFPPHGLGNFRQKILEVISNEKIGTFDNKLEGIILDIRNVKVVNNFGSIRDKDPTIHLDLVADCYVFKPKIGSIVRGKVKHISRTGDHIGVIIYRVFSVSIKLNKDKTINNIELESEIEFRIIDFNLKSSVPFIEGQLVAKEEKFHDIHKKNGNDSDAESNTSSEENDNYNSLSFEKKGFINGSYSDSQSNEAIEDNSFKVLNYSVKQEDEEIPPYQCNGDINVKLEKANEENKSNLIDILKYLKNENDKKNLSETKVKRENSDFEDFVSVEECDINGAKKRRKNNSYIGTTNITPDKSSINNFLKSIKFDDEVSNLDNSHQTSKKNEVKIKTEKIVFDGSSSETVKSPTKIKKKANTSSEQKKANTSKVQKKTNTSKVQKKVNTKVQKKANSSSEESKINISKETNESK